MSAPLPLMRPPPPAVWPRPDSLAERLLVVDASSGALADRRVDDLPSLLAPGDLLVVNDAATLPASLMGTANGRPVEVRLLEAPRDGVSRAVLFGPGDWRSPTESRDPPPRLTPGSAIDVTAVEGDGLRLIVTAVSADSPRLASVRFDLPADALWSALYRCGRAVQYSYLSGSLELWHVQTVYGSRPWAVESPSAGRPLRWSVLERLRRGGVALAYVTHAAGLSSTGDAALDAMLPLPERYQVPASTVDAIAAARRREGRVIAVGTTVVRALEGCAARHDGELVAETAVTDLRVGSRHRPQVVDGLLTGMHEPSTSHFQMLTAFADRQVLLRAHEHALATGYLWHEFGDSCLLLPRQRLRPRPRRTGRGENSAP